jgi:hypothetical protein
MLDSDLLQSYMRRFYGYGELSADYWFVGMEQGGGSTEREIVQRLNGWVQLSRGMVIDLVRIHHAVQNERGEFMSYYFEGRVKIQRTWAGLIRILIVAQGKEDFSVEAVRSVQSTSWGRSGGDNCLLELLPLPSPGVNKWYYNAWSDLPELRSREVYRAAVTGDRVQRLRELVGEYRPRCVVFYSVSPDYLARWSQIAGTDFSLIEPEIMCSGNQGQSFTARFHSNGNTLFVVIYHPVYTGLTKEYFAKVGQAIREKTA